MRAFALPAAVILSLCLYMPFPVLQARFYQALVHLHGSVKNIFENKQIDTRHALPAFLLITGAAVALIAALHPVLSAIVMAPLFTFSAVMPACAATKETLDSGKFARDIPAYEKNVRKQCLSLTPAFVRECIAPMLLLAAGTPLYVGAALGYMHAALCALSDEDDRAAHMLRPVSSAADRVFSAMLMLCAGLVGRNPLRIRAANAQERLMRTLGIAGDRSDTHAPMAGDIAQGIFVCSFAAGLLCLMLTLVLMAVC